MNNVVISTEAVNRFREAASQVTGGGAPRASRWLVLKDDVAMLRKRGVSYRAISELLSQNGISASPSGLMRFCRRVLKEKRSHKLSAKRRANSAHPLKGVPIAPANATLQPGPAGLRHTTSAPTETPTFTSRGPRIAKVEQLPAGEQI